MLRIWAGSDAIALLGAANYQLNMRRRESITDELNNDYRHSCSPTVPFTDFLFGDDVKLSKQLKDLTEEKKVGKNLAKPSYRPDFNRQRNYRRAQENKPVWKQECTLKTISTEVFN